MTGQRLLFDLPDAVVSDLGPEPDWAEEWAEDPYRYLLTPRAWDSRLPILAMIGLNPSTASTMDVAAAPGQHARKNGPDPTVTRFMNFARRDGFGGVVIGNAFALRSTSPKALREHADPFGPKNGQALLRIREMTGHIVVCWGADPMVTVEHERKVLSYLGDVRCFGTTALGAPRHPLYLPSDTAIVPYRGRA